MSAALALDAELAEPVRCPADECDRAVIGWIWVLPDIGWMPWRAHTVHGRAVWRGDAAYTGAMWALVGHVQVREHLDIGARQLVALHAAAHAAAQAARVLPDAPAPTLGPCYWCTAALVDDSGIWRDVSSGADGCPARPMLCDNLCRPHPVGPNACGLCRGTTTVYLDHDPEIRP